MEAEILIGNGLEGEQTENYFISEDVTFPLIKPTCNIGNFQSGDKIIKIWSDQVIIYNENNRNDSWSGAVDLLKQPQNQIIPIVVPDIRGGLLSVKCSAVIKDKFGRTYSITSNIVTFKILAKQPVKKNIRKLIDSDYLQIIIYKRSAFEQFNANGEPINNKGFGLYQILNPTVAEIWNWKMNVENAVRDFEVRKNLVAKIPGKYRTDDPVLYKGLPDFNDDELALETLQSYGIGNYHIPKKSGLSRKWKWQAGATNDGFAEGCLQLLKEILSGKIPVGWD